MAKRPSSSAGDRPVKRIRGTAEIDADLDNLAGVVININDTLLRLQNHVEEIDLKTIFVMNAVAVSRKKRGGLILDGNTAEMETKSLMQWYREGGRDTLVMRLQEAQREIHEAAKALGETKDGDNATAIDDTPSGGSGPH